MKIYGLQDPRKKVIRYIGFTSKSPNHRLKKHIGEVNCKRSSHYRKNRWIAALLKEGVTPEIIVLQETTKENWKNDEMRWISHYKLLGNDLCNHTSGGDGTSGFKWTPKLRTRMLEIFKNRPPPSDNTKHKMALSHTGLKSTPESIAKHRIKVIGTKRKSHTDEAKAKMSQTETGKKESPEVVERKRARMKGRRPSEACLNAVVNANKCRILTDEQRNVKRQKQKDNWNNPEYRAKMNARWTPERREEASRKTQKYFAKKKAME